MSKIWRSHLAQALKHVFGVVDTLDDLHLQRVQTFVDQYLTDNFWNQVSQVVENVLEVFIDSHPDLLDEEFFGLRGFVVLEKG